MMASSSGLPYKKLLKENMHESFKKNYVNVGRRTMPKIDSCDIGIMKDMNYYKNQSEVYEPYSSAANQNPFIQKKLNHLSRSKNLTTFRPSFSCINVDDPKSIEAKRSDIQVPSLRKQLIREVQVDDSSANNFILIKEGKTLFHTLSQIKKQINMQYEYKPKTCSTDLHFNAKQLPQKIINGEKYCVIREGKSKKPQVNCPKTFLFKEVRSKTKSHLRQEMLSSHIKITNGFKSFPKLSKTSHDHQLINIRRNSYQGRSKCRPSLYAKNMSESNIKNSIHKIKKGDLNSQELTCQFTDKFSSTSDSEMRNNGNPINETNERSGYSKALHEPENDMSLVEHDYSDENFENEQEYFVPNSRSKFTNNEKNKRPLDLIKAGMNQSKRQKSNFQALNEDACKQSKSLETIHLSKSHKHLMNENSNEDKIMFQNTPKNFFNKNIPPSDMPCDKDHLKPVTIDVSLCSSDDNSIVDNSSNVSFDMKSSLMCPSPVSFNSPLSSDAVDKKANVVLRRIPVLEKFVAENGEEIDIKVEPMNFDNTEEERNQNLGESSSLLIDSFGRVVIKQEQYSSNAKSDSFVDNNEESVESLFEGFENSNLNKTSKISESIDTATDLQTSPNSRNLPITRSKRLSSSSLSVKGDTFRENKMIQEAKFCLDLIMPTVKKRRLSRIGMKYKKRNKKTPLLSNNFVVVDELEAELLKKSLEFRASTRLKNPSVAFKVSNIEIDKEKSTVVDVAPPIQNKEVQKKSRSHFKCKECLFSSESKATFIIHCRTHYKDKNASVSEMSKTTKFRNRKNKINRHKPFQCNVCGYLASTSGNLFRHVRTHKGFIPYQCMVCKLCFTDAVQLKSHIETQHTKNKGKNLKYNCYTCFERFPFKASLDNHKRTHHIDKKYVCPLCYMECNDRVTLKYHMKTHGPSNENEEEKSSCDLMSLPNNENKIEIGEEQNSNISIPKVTNKKECTDVIGSKIGLIKGDAQVNEDTQNTSTNLSAETEMSEEKIDETSKKPVRKRRANVSKESDEIYENQMEHSNTSQNQNIIQQHPNISELELQPRKSLRISSRATKNKLLKTSECENSQIFSQNYKSPSKPKTISKEKTKNKKYKMQTKKRKIESADVIQSKKKIKMQTKKRKIESADVIQSKKKIKNEQTKDVGIKDQTKMTTSQPLPTTAEKAQDKLENVTLNQENRTLNQKNQSVSLAKNCEQTCKNFDVDNSLIESHNNIEDNSSKIFSEVGTALYSFSSESSDLTNQNKEIQVPEKTDKPLAQSAVKKIILKLTNLNILISQCENINENICSAQTEETKNLNKNSINTETVQISPKQLITGNDVNNTSEEVNIISSHNICKDRNENDDGTQENFNTPATSIHTEYDDQIHEQISKSKTGGQNTTEIIRKSDSPPHVLEEISAKETKLDEEGTQNGEDSATKNELDINRSNSNENVIHEQITNTMDDNSTEFGDKFKNILSFKCNFCSFKADKLFKLNEHLENHSSMSPFECSFCPKTFSNAGELKLHIQEHDDDDDDDDDKETL